MSVARILAEKGTNVVTAQPHRTLGEVIELLASHGIGAIVVSDMQGNLLGILSERDIVRAIASRGAEALSDAASQHMTSKVVTTTEDESVLETMEKMNLGRFRHLPVIKDGKLGGILSIGDVVKYRVAEIEHERLHLRQYIETA
jgi:CBS domain-containing protein